MEKPRLKLPAYATKEPFVLNHDESIEVPAAINQYLRDYQREGVQFLYDLYSKGHGGILGDDMGLGKTIQVIALLAAVLRKQGNHRDVVRQMPKFIRNMSPDDEESGGHPHQTFLIITPGSVLYNWIDELDTWGHFSVRKYHGTDKSQTLADIIKHRVEVVVTTFDTYRLNCDVNASIAVALSSLPTARRFGLSGTILQNSMQEMWAILNWARPGCLGTLPDFIKDYVNVIETGQQHSATKRELATARKKMMELREIRRKVVLRRTKQLISHQLPQKDDNVVFCQLSRFQEDVYRAILDHPDVRDGVLRMEETCDCGRQRMRSRCCHKFFSGDVKWSQVMMSYMHLLMKVSNHAALLIPDESTADNQRIRARDICDIAFRYHPEFVTATREASFRTLSHPKYCGKMKVLQGLLEVFSRKKAKVLLFSYSTRMLDILEQYIISMGYDYRRLDGSVNNKARMDIVREVNSDPHIFICLISTKAGGLGLNLTGANVVILFDPNWNPSNDLQAQDRAYRIGQYRDVQVFRLISAGTIEENMYLRQIYKQQLDNVSVSSENAKRLFDAIRGDNKRKGELFGVKNMFALRIGDTCLTHDILQRTENIEAALTGFNISTYIPPAAREDNSKRTSAISDDNSAYNSDENSACHSGSNSDVDGEDISDDNSDEDVNYGTNRQSSSMDIPSVSQVLASDGVVHVHDNRHVVGSSVAENYMTKCAIEDVFDGHTNSQIPAVQCPPSKELGDACSKLKHSPRRCKSVRDHNTVEIKKIGSHQVLIGQTPRAVKREQFMSMARYLGVSSCALLASRILAMTTKERITFLNEFYSSLNPTLGHVFTLQDVRSQGLKHIPELHNSCDDPHMKSALQTDKRSFLATCNSDSDTQPSVIAVNSDNSSDATFPLMKVGRSDSPKKSSLSPWKCRLANHSPRKRVKSRLRRYNLASEKHLSSDAVDVLEGAATDGAHAKKSDDDGLHVPTLIDDMTAASGEDKLTTWSLIRRSPHKTSFSAIDDIFCEITSNNARLRKPAPVKKSGKRENRRVTLAGNCVIDTSCDGHGTSEVSSATCYRQKESSTGSFGGDVASECESALKLKCRKRNRNVERLIERGEKDFTELFERGKMVLRSRRADVIGDADVTDSHGGPQGSSNMRDIFVEGLTTPPLSGAHPVVSAQWSDSNVDNGSNSLFS